MLEEYINTPSENNLSEWWDLLLDENKQSRSNDLGHSKQEHETYNYITY